MRSSSSVSRRKRRTSSSVSDDLPDPPVPVMPSTGTARLGRQGVQLGQPVGGSAPGLERGDRAGQGRRRPGRLGSPAARGRRGSASGPAARSTSQAAIIVLTMRGEAEGGAVVGGEDAGDAVGLQRLDLGGHDHAAAPAEHLGVGPAGLRQPVDQVAEVLDVAALVRADGDALHVLLDGRPHDLVDRAVVPQVDDLGPLRLEDPPHDVDRGVVAVEQAGRGHEADGMDRARAAPGSRRRRAGRSARSSAEYSWKPNLLSIDVKPLAVGARCRFAARPGG